ncbi:MAG: peptidylprolyl isomerase [Myxococcota bacterium]
MARLVAIFAGLWACNGSSLVDEEGAPPSRAPDGAVIARVGEAPITDRDFAAAAAEQPDAAAGEDLDERRAVLDELIENEILFQEAIKRDLYRDPKVRRNMVGLLIRKEVYDRVHAEEIPEEELKAYFEAHQNDFVIPEKAQVRRIFVRVDDDRDLNTAKSLMTDLRRQIIRDPGKFVALAEKHSEDAYARRGGELGLITREGKPGIPQLVVDKAFDLRAGQLSDVFETDQGLNLVLTVLRRDAIERTYDQMKGMVMRQVRAQRRKEMKTTFVEQLKQRYSVDIDEKTLANTYVQVEAAAPTVDPRELLETMKSGDGEGPERSEENE